MVLNGWYCKVVMLKLLESYERVKVIIYRPLDELLQNATPAFSHAPTYINFYLQSMYVQRIGTIHESAKLPSIYVRYFAAIYYHTI